MHLQQTQDKYKKQETKIIDAAERLSRDTGRDTPSSKLH